MFDYPPACPRVRSAVCEGGGGGWGGVGVTTVAVEQKPLTDDRPGPTAAHSEAAAMTGPALPSHIPHQ